MFIERTQYYAKPGLRERVLEVRRKACLTRVRIGLPAGTIRVSRGGDGPDVSWECAFATVEDSERDLAARAASPEFEAVRKEMGALLARFERHFEKREPPSLPNAITTIDLRGRAIVAREVEFPSAGRMLKGYLHLPPGPGPFACMVTNHGSSIDQGSLDVCRPNTAAWLMSWNIASFLPHRHGYGNSPGPGWRSDVTAAYGTQDYDRQLGARLDRESDDVIAALAAVERLPEIMSDHIGVMGSSFGGTNTLFAAAKSARWRCAIDFAGAAMNWDRAPGLRAMMHDAASRVRCPMFFIQAENDYSIGPTRELPAALVGGELVVESKIYPPHGLTPHEGHLFESTGQMLWAPDARRFLERHL